MPLPASITTVTLTGEFVGPDGTPQSGLMELLLLSEWSVPASDVVVVRRPIRGVIGTDGKFSVAGIAVNTDPDASSTSQYLLRVFFDDGVPGIDKVIQFASNSPAIVKYEDIVAVPVTPPVVGPQYATVEYVNTLIGAVEGGEGVIPGYTHTQAVASTVWVINHALGWNPAGIQVFNTDGEEIAGGVVSYSVANQQVTIAFDISFAGTARLT